MNYNSENNKTSPPAAIPKTNLFGEPETHGDGRVTDGAKTALVRVAFEKAGDNLFDYGMPEDLVERLQTGQRVKVPFGRGNRLETAFCVDFPETADVKKVKFVYEAVDAKP